MSQHDECLVFRAQTLIEHQVPLWADPRARLIGLEAYVAAGGAIRRDIVSDALNAAWLCDVVLLNRLVREKLERAAEPLRREGWSVVEVRPGGVTPAESGRWIIVPPTHERRHTSAEKRRIAALAAARNKVAKQIRNEHESDPMLARQLEEYEEAIATLQDAVQEWSADVRARCRAVVLLSNHGMQVIRGIVLASR